MTEVTQPDPTAAHLQQAEAQWRASPRDVACIARYASLLGRAGRIQDSIAHYRQALELAPKSAELWFNLANALSRVPSPDEARAAYGEALKLNPSLVPALVNLANLERDHGNKLEAVSRYQAAIRLAPDLVRAHMNLGNLLRDLGHTEEAVSAHRRSVALAPDHADAFYNLGNALRDAGHSQDAAGAYERALHLQPGHAAAVCNHALLLRSVGDHAAARTRLQRALETQPGMLDARIALAQMLADEDDLTSAIELVGNAPTDPAGDDVVRVSLLARFCLAAGRHDSARRACEAWCRAAPQDPDARLLLGNALHQLDDLPGAIAQWLQVVARHPDHAHAHLNLGTAFAELKDVARAVHHVRIANRLLPDDAEASIRLALLLLKTGLSGEALALARTLAARQAPTAQVLSFQGQALVQQARITEAVAIFDQAAAMDPASASVLSQGLFARLYSETLSADLVADTHREYGARIRAMAPAAGPDAATERRRRSPPLRVGYLSPDLVGHPVGLFMEPILEHHDRAAVTSYCYADSKGNDATTERLRHAASHWRPCTGMSDDDLFALIQSDQIDILVDLAGHSAGGSRQVLMARRPAPVQMLYLGYPGSSGQNGIDYVIADPYVLPDDAAHRFSETAVRPSPCFLCFKPPQDAPAVSLPPVLANGYVTFGSYNHLPKLSDTTLGLWAQVLDAVPGSKVILKASPLADEATRELTLERLVRAGVSAERLTLLGPTSPLSRHLADFARIDIALDPTPFNGGTTTCQTLWMGVPVVSLVTEGFPGRMGLSVLSAIGHPEWATGSAQDYVRVASELASDQDRLAALRSQLRGRMQASSLCDAAGFTRRLEQAFLQAAG